MPATQRPIRVTRSAGNDHSHPIIDHHRSAVYFTSDHEGKRAIYRLSM